MFGLSGPSRSGKSTLAAETVKGFPIHFHSFQTAEVMKKHGISLVDGIGPVDRLRAQCILLDEFLTQLRGLPKPWITDRTPLDMAAYTLAEIRMGEIDPKFDEAVLKYVSECVNATAANFALVAMLPPLPFYTMEPGKHPPNRSFQLHHYHLVCSMGIEIASSGRAASIIINATDLDERVRVLRSWMDQAFINVKKQFEGIALH